MRFRTGRTFLEDYDRLSLSNMSVHHLDVLRFLFGDPDEITTLTRKDPRTKFKNSEGITVSTLRFPSGVLALSIEDVWSGPPAGRLQGRPAYQLACRRDGRGRERDDWLADRRGVNLDLCFREGDGRRLGDATWDAMWFSHAFVGVMEQLQDAVKTGEPPALSVADNVKTMALVEAGYRAIDEGRTVKLSEVPTN